MPLFMDFHKIENVTVEEVKAAHMADLAVQDKYGVKFLQFWVNQEAGTVFCLVEGPDKETCELVHQSSHGNIPCAMTEVEVGFYKSVMGDDQKIDHGFVHNKDGTIDQGYRTILVANIYINKKNDASKTSSQTLREAKKLIAEKIAVFKGREILWETNDNLIGVFNDSALAVECSSDIFQKLNQLKEKEPELIFKLGISAAQPVTEKGDFFNEAIKLAYQLSIISKENQVFVSSLVKKLCKEELLASHPIRSLTIPEEEFVCKLFRITEENLTDQQFDLSKLSNEICVSRPQLYRKIVDLTGRPPNMFMRDIRMEKALALLKQKSGNVAEIAFETGFNSPSYFTKCFTEKFGCTPTNFAKNYSD